MSGAYAVVRYPSGRLVNATLLPENGSYTVTVFDANGLSTTRHGSLALTLPLRGNIIYLFRGGEKG